jgi:hypothetical protein
VFVERLLIERRIGAILDDLAVRALGFAVALLDEQSLAAAELRLVDVRRIREFSDQLVERRERILEPSLGLVRSRELVEHKVVLLVVRIAFEQLLVQPDRIAADVAAKCLNVRLKLHDIRGLELQIGEAPHGLRAQHRVV